LAGFDMTPTELLINSMDNLDDIDIVMVIRRHKISGISFEVSTGNRTDAYALANIVSAYTLSDILKDGIHCE
jgi:hypothetical protein